MIFYQFSQHQHIAVIIWSKTDSHDTETSSLGRYHGAMVTNREEWERAAVDAGRSSGDLIHPLVYCPELHFSEFASAVADMKNSSAVCFYSFKPTTIIIMYYIVSDKVLFCI